MIKKTALGKGLASLIPEEVVGEDKDGVVKIPINLITSNEEQPRKYFDVDKIGELSQSIKEHGIIQPIILKKKDDIYVIVAGERRWRAAKNAGLKEVPAIIMDLTESEVLEISLIENIVREDLNPIEEAIAYRKLIDEFNLTQDEISKRISKSRSAIANCMRLLNLDSRVQDYLIEGVISEGHGRAILAIDNKDRQYELAQRVVDDNLNVRQTENLVKKFVEKINSENVNSEKPTNNSNLYIKDIVNKLEGYFNTKVILQQKKNNKGKIEIEFYSDDDLQRILEILNV